MMDLEETIKLDGLHQTRAYHDRGHCAFSEERVGKALTSKGAISWHLRVRPGIYCYNSVNIIQAYFHNQFHKLFFRISSFYIHRYR